MNEEKIMQKLIEHDESLVKIQSELKNTLKRDEFNQTMDQVMAILKRLDQKRIFTTEWIRRIETDVERVKQHLHIS